MSEVISVDLVQLQIPRRRLKIKLIQFNCFWDIAIKNLSLGTSERENARAIECGSHSPHLHLIHPLTGIRASQSKGESLELHRDPVSPRPQRRLPKRGSCCGARGRRRPTRTSTSRTSTSGEGRSISNTKKTRTGTW